jgi:hypothetical protein
MRERDLDPSDVPGLHSDAPSAGLVDPSGR